MLSVVVQHSAASMLPRPLLVDALARSLTSVTPSDGAVRPLGSSFDDDVLTWLNFATRIVLIGKQYQQYSWYCI